MFVTVFLPPWRNFSKVGEHIFNVFFVYFCILGSGFVKKMFRIETKNIPEKNTVKSDFTS